MSHRTQRYRDTVIDLISLVVVGTLTWQLWQLGSDFARYDDKTLYLGVPLAPVAYFMAMMSGLTLVVLLAQVLNQFTPGHRTTND
jgi:TRAP-type C4-dicarboxylate transport system permease small subunit